MRVHAIHQGQDHQVQVSQAESSIRPNKGRSKPVRPDLFAIGSSADDPARAGPAGLGQSGPSPSARARFISSRYNKGRSRSNRPRSKST